MLTAEESECSVYETSLYYWQLFCKTEIMLKWSAFWLTDMDNGIGIDCGSGGVGWVKGVKGGKIGTTVTA